ncbi:MAG: serine/threonine-protein kinase [Methylotenera sp.]|nr:serine/threonine-protein kinase [Methylotenera sp.]
MSSTQNLALPAGYWLQDYEIRKVLSSGGFSFVYLARDKDKKTVAIKEYLPTSIALRTNGATVLPNADDVALFRHGLKCFFDEGLALAKIDHKNIVRVLNFFRANETVYMVMQYERGKSLQDYILEHQGLVSEKFIRRVFSELSNGLREVHTQKLLHLDIKPANIYIRLDGSPVLLDFGSARQALNENLAKSSPSYTPGFASPEQYYDRKLLGPWSDIYSIGATMYSCLTRTSPMAANLRIKNDLLTPAVKIGNDNYSQGLLEIIDKCLSLDYLERPQSVFSLQKSLLAFSPALKKKASLMNKIVDVLNKPISIK